MFALYKTVETAAGLLETQVHGVYAARADAVQIGENLRLLYPWVKSVRVQAQEAAADDGQLPLNRKKMAGSITPRPARRRKSS